MYPEETSERRFDVAGDRISRLPDSVLRVILSFVVTKEAVATSVLSRRWKSVWMSVPYLDFHFHFHKHGNKKYTEFIDFVNHVLDLNTCSLLNRFNLVWDPKSISSSSVTDTWINIAITTKYVRHLSLRCVGDPTLRRFGNPSMCRRRLGDHLSLRRGCCEYDYNFMCLNPYVIPSNVFCCGDSLHSLELIACNISIDHQTVISLPNLETLIMSPVTFKSDQACNMILSGCPLLKFLHLFISKCDFDVTISSDTLIHLELRFGRPNCRFILSKAPSLEYLMLKGGFITEISIEDTSLVSLVEAHLDVRLYYCSTEFNNSIVEAVRAFRFVKALTLSFDVLQALANATISLSTEFKRLVKLVAGTCSSVKDFIHHSENLQVLIILKDEDEAQYGSYFDYQSKRNNLEEVPRCLSNSLKEVRIFKYDGSKHEEELVQFIQQHGRVLEIMKTEDSGDSGFSEDSETRERKFKRMEEKIRRLRNSGACQVQRRPPPPTTGLRTPYLGDSPDNDNGDNVDTTSQPLSPTIPTASSTKRPKVGMKAETWFMNKMARLGVRIDDYEEFLERATKNASEKNLRRKLKAAERENSEYISGGSISRPMPDVVVSQQVSKLSEENSKLREELSVVRQRGMTMGKSFTLL